MHTDASPVTRRHDIGSKLPPAFPWNSGQHFLMRIAIESSVARALERHFASFFYFVYQPMKAISFPQYSRKQLITFFLSWHYIWAFWVWGHYPSLVEIYPKCHLRHTITYKNRLCCLLSFLYIGIMPSLCHLTFVFFRLTEHGHLRKIVQQKLNRRASDKKESSKEKKKSEDKSGLCGHYH